MNCCVRVFTWLVLIASGYLLLFTVYDTLLITYKYFQYDEFQDAQPSYKFAEELLDPEIYQFASQPNNQTHRVLSLQNKSEKNQLQKKQLLKKHHTKINKKVEHTNGNTKNQQQKQLVRKKPRDNRIDTQVLGWQKRNELRDTNRIFYVQDELFQDCVQRKHLPGLQGKIIKSFVSARNPKKCKNIQEKDVKLVGVVAMHHKAGTVLRKGFYFSICARSGINFLMLRDLPFQQTHNYNFVLWQNYKYAYSLSDANVQTKQNITVNDVVSNKSTSIQKKQQENIVKQRKFNKHTNKRNDTVVYNKENRYNVNFNQKIFNNEIQVTGDNDSINGSNVICRDYHPCNEKAIIHAKITFRENCIEAGVKCRNWYSILCFVQQCRNKLKMNKNIRIINPVRNPFNMVISAYLYHKGSSPESWAVNLTLGQIGFVYPINGKDLRNVSLSSALKKYAEPFGLEIAFRIMSNDLLDMILLHLFSKKQKNVMSSKFEDCMEEFSVAMKRELDFIGFYEKTVPVQEKQAIVQFGSWVTTEKNLQMQQKKKHITSSQSKQALFKILQKHFRFRQLQKIAEILEYNSSSES
eukprot:TRINITY_DN4922_c0_g1_i1.p1 TRINITY_DN4922_c0_g1~~TRINITY_DN4922_c0_g1_i1.p1  ORF type:complete len:579 (+),score=28.96 TRINITY_DN4922_c0_g1_i1:658-2394(+)